MKRSATALLVLLATGQISADTPPFDRPGLAFATATLAPGGLIWEQGLPDFTTDRSDGLRATSWTADTLLKFGLARGLELQLGANSLAGLRLRGNGVDASHTGGGDGWASLKWAPIQGEHFSLALLGTATLPFGAAPVGGDGHDYDLGVTATWAFPNEGELALYADRAWGDDGSGWLFSPSYAFDLGAETGAYVELGYGTGAQHMRAAGAGITHLLGPRVQVDAWFLRGLDEATADWQGGIGIAWVIR